MCAVPSGGLSSIDDKISSGGHHQYYRHLPSLHWLPTSTTCQHTIHKIINPLENVLPQFCRNFVQYENWSLIIDPQRDEKFRTQSTILPSYGISLVYYSTFMEQDIFSCKVIPQCVLHIYTLHINKLPTSPFNSNNVTFQSISKHHHRQNYRQSLFLNLTNPKVNKEAFLNEGSRMKICPDQWRSVQINQDLLSFVR